jgi:2'-5' RNA ligase
LVNAADYDRYAIVAFAPTDVQGQVEEIRQQAPPCGKPMMAAHLTVKGSFVQPTDLETIVERARRVCLEAAPSEAVSRDVHVFQSPGDLRAVVLRMAVADGLTRLKWRLVDELKDLCVTDYPAETAGRFTPHLTLVEAIPAAALPDALAVVERHQPSFQFPIADLYLCGRRDGVVWEPLERFALST